MKSARNIRQTLYRISLLLTALASEILYHQQPVLSQKSLEVKNSNDLVCYMQTSDGRIISLNNLCGSSEGSLALTTTDRQFLDNYQRSLQKRLSKSSLPVVISQAQQQPQAAIAKAQSICTALRSGMPTELLKPQGKPEIDIINALAPKYYCPEFND